MCGILGFVTKKQGLKVDKTKLDKTLKSLSHRGPDGCDSQLFCGHDFSVYLGHTRLAIIDLDSHASQPMEYLERYSLVFNGEIYNYLELRSELVSRGYGFKTQSDSEVILAAYDCWGEACVQRFNGMWALAILDKTESTLFCSRDRFGVKPFYYFEDCERLIFSSEIGAILPFLDKRRANMELFAPYIARGFLDFDDESFFKDIRRLGASQNMCIELDSGKKRIWGYFSLVSHDECYMPERILSLLEDSIELRLRSDVRVGTCLSGGLDSSGIAALASDKYRFGDRFVAIHAKSSLRESDESEYARILAAHAGIELCIIEPSVADFLNSIDDVFLAQGEPFGGSSIFMQYFVMRKAHELGIKVLLDGQGADEVFLGYEHYLKFILKDLRDRYVMDSDEFFRDLKLFRYDKSSILDGLVGIDSVSFAWEIIRDRGNFNPEYLKKERLYPLLLYPKNLHAFQVREIFSNNLPALLRYEDRDSMRFGVETRLPYLDFNLVSYVTSLRTEEKFQNGYLKYALREALELSGKLPKSIVWRYNKMGFESPQSLWIESYRSEMMSVVERSQILKALFTRLDIRRDDFLWKLFSIAKWEELFDVEV